ncbi:hypothetical protein LJK60_001714, partial [Salmonella enterica]|nr:hypothetical protein [Salmonella enterica]
MAVGTSAKAASAGVAVGENSNSAGAGNVALGQRASTTAGTLNSVALGAWSQSTRSNEVSIGYNDFTRTISHVSAGTEENDAVNVRQLNTAKDDAVTAANKHTDTEITTLDGKAQGYANTAKDDAVTAANKHT